MRVSARLSMPRKFWAQQGNEGPSENKTHFQLELGKGELTCQAMNWVISLKFLLWDFLLESSDASVKGALGGRRADRELVPKIYRPGGQHICSIMNG